MPIESYKRTSTKQPSQFTSTTASERKFYQSSRWRNYRAKLKASSLVHDFIDAANLVEKGLLDGKSYTAWLLTRAPLCRVCFASHLATAANVLDHIKPIRDGGDVFAASNLQWLCDSCHNKKSNTDRRARNE
jgi:5-methylcytosine-specific restriction endonuclease McrA